MYIETCKKKKVEQNEHKKHKIEQLKEIELDDGDENVKNAAVAKVLGGVHSGWVLLEGRGITPTQLKMKGGIGASSIQVPESFIDSIKEKLEIEMEKKLANREEEMRRKMREEMKEEIENSRMEITCEFVKVLSQLGVNTDSPMMNNFMAPSPGGASSVPRTMPHSSTGNNNPLDEE
ncbi:hypothetical protein Ancab_039789 [Ancistrocladus abbreviatus]